MYSLKNKKTDDSKLTDIEKLIEGNKYFQSKFGRDYRGYIENQKPHTAILSCSDSRVPTERIFNLAKGEIFVVREAGNIPDNVSIASLEYSVVVLGVKNLIVLGHTECCAVKAAKSGQDLGSIYLNNLAENIRQNIKIEDDLDTSIINNAKASLLNLTTKSSIIRDAVNNNQINCYYGLYDISSGQVVFYKIN